MFTLRILSNFFSSNNQKHSKLSLENITLGAEIGRGSFSTVYLGELYLGWAQYRNIAVKLIPSSESNKEKFKDEKKIMEELKNKNAPNVIELLGCVETIHFYHIVMNYAVKGSLEDYIDKNPTLSFEQKVKLAKEVLRSIEFLHDINIIHCDIKTANILLDEDRKNQTTVPKLSDFGLSIKEGQRQKPVGTPLWWAPELFLNEPNSKKSDMFSYAIFLRVLFTWLKPDEPAFDKINEPFGKKVIDGFRQPIPSHFAPNLTKIITLGWMKNPDERPTATKMLPMLDSLSHR